MERKDDVLNCWPRHWSFSLAFPGKPRLQEEAGVSGTSLTTALSWTRGPGRGFFPGCLGFKSHTTLPAGAGVVPRVTYIIGTPGTGRHEGRGLPCENLVAIGRRGDAVPHQPGHHLERPGRGPGEGGHGGGRWLTCREEQCRDCERRRILAPLRRPALSPAPQPACVGRWL